MGGKKVIIGINYNRSLPTKHRKNTKIQEGPTQTEQEYLVTPLLWKFPLHSLHAVGDQGREALT